MNAVILKNALDLEGGGDGAVLLEAGRKITDRVCECLGLSPESQRLISEVISDASARPQVPMKSVYSLLGISYRTWHFRVANDPLYRRLEVVRQGRTRSFLFVDEVAALFAQLKRKGGALGISNIEQEIVDEVAVLFARFTKRRGEALGVSNNE